MSNESKTPTVAGFKNQAARVLPGTDAIAAAIRNKAINMLPKLYQDLFETLEGLGQHDKAYQKEAETVRYSALRVGIKL